MHCKREHIGNVAQFPCDYIYIYKYSVTDSDIIFYLFISNKIEILMGVVSSTMTPPTSEATGMIMAKVMPVVDKITEIRRSFSDPSLTDVLLREK